MAGVIQKPDSLSLCGNLKKFIIAGNQPVSFVLKKGDTVLLESEYIPGDDNLLEIDVREIVESQLTYKFNAADTTYLQAGIWADFTARIDDTDYTFRAVRSGVANLADTATNWLKLHFLTWQPRVKQVTYYSPEWLTYYAVETCLIKLKATYSDKSTRTISLQNCTAGAAYTLNLQYGVVAGKLGNTYPSYYEVWTEKAGGTKLSESQFYAYSDVLSEDEQWYLFENSLGGLDTFRAYGANNLNAEHEHNISEIGDVREEYQVDTERKYTKNTGHLDDYSRRWLLDFFPSRAKYVYDASSIRKIVVTESNATYVSSELPSSYTFTWQLAEVSALLNLVKNDIDIPDNLVAPDLSSPDFILPPRLVELPRVGLSEGVLIPAFDPFAPKPTVTTFGAIHDTIKNAVIKELEDEIAGIKIEGPGGSGGSSVEIIKKYDLTIPTDENVFSALRTLDEIGHVLIEANDMFLRKDIPDTAHENILFDKKIGSSIYVDDWEGKGWEITDPGAATLDSLRVRSDILVGNSVSSPSFASGFPGWGVRLDIPTATAEMDNLFVRKTFTAYEIVYSQIYGLGGSQIVSDLNKIGRVEVMADRYRCYMDDMDGLMLMNLRKGDGVRIQRRTGTTSIKYLFGRCIGIDNDYFDIAIPLISGSGQPEAGDFVMRWGNNEDINRQGLIYLTTADSGAPFIDVYDGITEESTKGKLKARLGNLKGIRTMNGDQLKGYGAYLNGVYIENSTYYTDTGETIDQRFVAMDGKFDSTIGSLLDDMSGQSGNILVNSSFAQNTNYWTPTNTVYFIDVNNDYLWMDGSFYVDKEAVADIYNDGGQNRLRIRNTCIIQQNELFRLPDRTDVSEDGYTYSFAFKYKVLRAGTLLAGFPGTDLYVEQQLSPSDGYQKFSKVARWNETGDFELRFTGEILIYGVSLFNDALADAQIKLQTQIDQTNELIKLLATKDYVDKETGKIYIHYDSQLQITAEQMSGISTKVDNINNTIESSGWITEAQGTTLFAKKDMENGSSIVNAINVGTNGILIAANRINLVGAVSYSSFNSSLQGEFNNKVDFGDLSSTLSNYVTKYYLTNTLDDYALASDLSNLVSSTALANELKNYASKSYTDSSSTNAMNQLKTALINGNTTIMGGFISTKLLDVDSIFANMADIGGFTIQNNGIFSNNTYSGESSSKFFLYSSGSSAFLGFSSSGKWAGIGLNTLPATLGGASALLRLDYTISHNDINYGAVIDVHGGRRNYALYCIGGLKVNGSIATARYAPSSSGSNTITNNIGYRDTFVFSVSNYTNVFLPSRATVTSNVGTVHAEYGDTWSEVGYNAVIFVHVIVAYFSPNAIYIKAEDTGTPIVDNNGNSIDGIKMEKGDCATFAYFNQRWYTFSRNF